MLPIDKNKGAFLNIVPDVRTVFTFGRCAMSSNALVGRCVF